MKSSDFAQKIIEKYHINDIPINIENIIKNEDILLLKEELPEDISGILDIRDKPIIFVNSAQHSNRQRFSMAHELGHYLLHSPSGIHVDRKTFFRNSLSSEGLSQIEIEANQFAAEILMPTNLVENEFRRHEDIIDNEDDIIKEIADKFQVSTAAMVIKLQQFLKGYF